MSEVYQDLLNRMAELTDLAGVQALLSWDQETYMPQGAQQARGRQMAIMGTVAHKKFTCKEMGQLLEALQGAEKPEDPDARVSVERVAWDYERAVKIPEELVRETAEAESQSVAMWSKSRPENDFEAWLPHLEKVLDLARKRADYLKTDGQSRYDALLEGYEPGLTGARVEQVFGGLRDAVVPLVQRIADAEPIPTACIEGTFDAQKQWDLGMDILRDMGFDFDRGRQDRSAHPFTSGFHPTDVRLTTRIQENNFRSGFFSSLHEGGHGLYEQGIAEKDWATPLGSSISLGIHESQSRMWENLVGRSKAFWKHYYEPAQKLFQKKLDGIPLDDFWRAINEVRPSLIRVEADEVTYSLHIILRFEIERGLIEGELEPKDLPEIWNEKMREYLGIEPPDNRDGCMQDIHWAWGLFGYFPTYTLGNIYAGQLWQSIRTDLPDLSEKIEKGQLTDLTHWLRTHVHEVGRRRLAEELIENITGQTLSPQPYITYLESKFTEVYRLD